MEKNIFQNGNIVFEIIIVLFHKKNHSVYLYEVRLYLRMFLFYYNIIINIYNKALDTVYDLQQYAER